MTEFKLLFSPFSIKGMELKNRIVMPPMTTNFAAEDGSITDKMVDYYETRARGGAGYIVVEAACIEPAGKLMAFSPGIWDDDKVPGYRQIVKACHTHGAKVALQIAHAGRQTTPMFTGEPTRGVSPLADPLTGELPIELSFDDIQDLLSKFKEAARRAVEAGFDAIEIHMAHGYLLAQFLSAHFNRRTDTYGGGIAGRLRFPIEVSAAVREVVGRDFPLQCRINLEEAVPGGRKLPETLLILPILQDAGIDCFHFTTSVFSDLIYAPRLPQWASNIANMGTPLACYTLLAKQAKAVLKVPVIAANRIKDPFTAEMVLREGRCDLVSMGRALIADPELPNKAKVSDIEDINPCIGCNEGCVQRLNFASPITCTVNPSAGREKELEIKPAEVKKKVFIVGGGPGGMEAARVAALRGHAVTLYEKSDRLGGQLNLACMPPTKQELAETVIWLSLQVKKAGVAVKLNTELTIEEIEKEKPDALVVATGAAQTPEGIKGTDSDNVVTAWDILSGRAWVPFRLDLSPAKIVVVGGGELGAEVADLLAEGNKAVTIVTSTEDIALEVNSMLRPTLMSRLSINGVKIITEARVKEITDDGITYKKDGAEATISGQDAVVLAVGVKSDNKLVSEAKGRVNELYVIGDAKEQRKALDAIREGLVTGKGI